MATSETGTPPAAHRPVLQLAVQRLPGDACAPSLILRDRYNDTGPDPITLNLAGHLSDVAQYLQNSVNTGQAMAGTSRQSA